VTGSGIKTGRAPGRAPIIESSQRRQQESGVEVLRSAIPRFGSFAVRKTSG
jgi:hypothetical protein